MKIANGNVEPSLLFLKEMELDNKSSRMRSKFVRMGIKYIQDELSEQKKEVIEKYAQRDEEDNIKHNEDGTGILFDDVKPYLDLMDEEWVVDESESNKRMLISVRDSLLSYEGKLSGDEADLYDELCEAFENLTYGD